MASSPCQIKQYDSAPNGEYLIPPGLRARGNTPNCVCDDSVGRTKKFNNLDQNLTPTSLGAPETSSYHQL